MGRMDVNLMRYLEGEHFRVLVSCEMGMKNHEVVPLALLAAISKIHRGGVSKICGDLCKHSLIALERGIKCDGYRLTVRGYDFLALRALCAREVVGSVGNQIGVGKESDVYVGGDVDLNDLVLKFHRLGRTSFRRIKEKRDYHQKRKNASWLYLSRLAAQKEFAFLSALAARNFPVPKAIDVCRHVVVMGLIDGITLYHVDSLHDVPALYHRLMSLIVKFASHGLIHGDFNEFNLMITKDEKVTVIDFPQMVSTDHPNAEYYFNRDVECIKTFFRKKFSYETDDFPSLEEVERKYNLDVELAASGFTKVMQKDLNKAYDEGNFNEHESDEDEEEEEEETSDMETIEEEEEDKDEEEMEDEKKRGEKSKKRLETCSRFDAWLEDASKQIEKIVIEEGEDVVEILKHQNTTVASVPEREYESDDGEAPLLVEGNDEEENEKTEKRKKKNKRSNQTVGTRSVMSVGSTIAPEEVKRRVAMELRRNKEKTKLRAKGKQSAVSRGRKSNKDTIGEYAGWDF
ncbi:hypothetical protein PFISCL1PPCAC_20024 [Pristionchus fissidentatus]|uniref:Serine/threonine-protein kinase RIO2 n=1 Tax=Pristionchus fissidentatus TaxID=1538716 RepID=A0AAV5WCH9_9BILA|nr:hypothetical protein PFISCL1PPCAC_20024 [Pristionchus fissidentatus]